MSHLTVEGHRRRARRCCPDRLELTLNVRRACQRLLTELIGSPPVALR
jgi:hypothetical protein